LTEIILKGGLQLMQAHANLQRSQRIRNNSNSNQQPASEQEAARGRGEGGPESCTGSGLAQLTALESRFLLWFNQSRGVAGRDEDDCPKEQGFV